MDNKLLYRRATRLVQWILQFIKFNLYAQTDYRRSNTHSPMFSNFTRFTWSLDLRIEFAEYLSEYPRDLCNSNFSKFDLVLGWVSSFCTEKSSLITFFISIFLFLAFFNILYGRAEIIGRPRQAVSIFHAARRIFSRVIGETFTLGNAIAR